MPKFEYVPGREAILVFEFRIIRQIQNGNYIHLFEKHKKI